MTVRAKVAAGRIARGIGGPALLILGLSGCQTTGPIGQGGPSLVVPTYSYTSGMASQGFARPRTEVEAALGEAMDDLQIRRVGLVEADAEATRVHGRTADGRRVDLTLLDRGPATEARVRVGLFGDEDAARTVLNRLAAHLGTLPAEASPMQDLTGLATDANADADPATIPYFSRQAVPDSVMLRGFGEANGTSSLLP
ncbi:DUF3568 family protein [Tautonia sociabilis]|uniref:DUF3568 family protein n=1 Tax=Tautonia sociabilis TaxID=2080755 RepID=A0A432MFK4_9BACT|nr:DUF3568 family protein [Tautonia sociabilis]RUL85008.1 DUF3568 family protein [Tautonia sociabilis]